MKLVPFALAATGLVVLCLAGCRKEEAKPETPASSPASYMKDKAFRARMREFHRTAVAIGERREAVNARQAEMVKIMGEKLKTSDRAAILKELEKNAEWRSLEAKGKAIDEEFMKNHRASLNVARERIAPKRGKGEPGTGNPNR